MWSFSLLPITSAWQVARQQNAAKKLQSVWRGLVARRRVAERYRSQRDADAAAETSDPRVHRYGLRRPDTDEEVCVFDDLRLTTGGSAHGFSGPTTA